nr:hypothetical protein Iba_chr02eCG7950 [Ipomoea batatas]
MPSPYCYVVGETEKDVAIHHPTLPPPPELTGPSHHAGAAAAALTLECRRMPLPHHCPLPLRLRRARGRHTTIVHRTGEDDGQKKYEVEELLHRIFGERTATSHSPFTTIAAALCFPF